MGCFTVTLQCHTALWYQHARGEISVKHTPSWYRDHVRIMFLIRPWPSTGIAGRRRAARQSSRCACTKRLVMVWTPLPSAKPSNNGGHTVRAGPHTASPHQPARINAPLYWCRPRSAKARSIGLPSPKRPITTLLFLAPQVLPNAPSHTRILFYPAPAWRGASSYMFALSFVLDRALFLDTHSRMHSTHSRKNTCSPTRQPPRLHTKQRHTRRKKPSTGRARTG